MNQAWDIYLSVFRRLDEKNKNVQFYELRNVAPRLLASENLRIAVPGTFRCDRRITRIAKFSQVLPVFASKQHPRKFTMTGDDGREYIFLLKGHEDIRQDERVMQLFGLVNTLLQTDAKTCKKDLMIRRYAVTPLSHHAGLMAMVPAVDTLNVLIREHRSPYVQNAETKAMEHVFERYDSVPLLKKVEIFRHAMDNTKGEDLQKVLWLKSLNSERWLERRTNYTRSLAVMSMVGYILGLGDRHPSNILLDRSSGKVIHIDFGDCFESAMRREKFPEKIPFRLTRMLQKAMEVSGIEGNFRNTCEQTMTVMRQNKGSLLAILEAFVYDPLLSFRLLNLKALIQQSKQRAGEEAVFAAPDLSVTEVKTGTLTQKGLLDALKKKTQNEIMQSIVEVTINRYKGATALDDAAAHSYALRNLDKKNDEAEISKLVTDKKDEERMKAELNQAAEVVVQRISDKLRGTEFPPRWSKYQRGKPRTERTLRRNVDYSVRFGANGAEPTEQGRLRVEDQVDLLIQQATSHENLAQCYPGWCPFW
jgi:serine/threonine-protein kinase mTOR